MVTLVTAVTAARPLLTVRGGWPAGLGGLAALGGSCRSESRS